MKFTMLPNVWSDSVADIEAQGHLHVGLDESPDMLVFNGGPDDLPDPLPESVQAVQAAFAGIEALDQSGILASSGVRWANAAGVYDDTVAESAVGLLLAVLHRHKEVTSWEVRPEVEAKTEFLFEDKTVAIIGAGGIGRRLIALLNAFGTKTIAVTRTGREVPGADESVAFSEVNSVWPTADYFVILAPLTTETRGMINAEVLAKMKRNAVIINVARGPLVVTEDLIAALRDGTIAGAGLDVTDPEPLHDDSPLWTMPNVVITPHTANTARFLHQRVGELTVRSWEALAAGERMPTEVDVTRGY
ncbi:D-isomer specific 2-hydroxyacid dehydrogenase family protein [Corynebacterium lubricantis]|uniref:D-isomer specific 2-hydroxyacid dehydrogenase family protein n=1 Tax=Corynebacterium lubricantis TaxID=541095 RepID=UPI0003998363|nr:D-isomer specific 2-hydroxyacid dehydrogenase family protein [Corynebacterium lubricantis]